ncbi:hypothetical protein [Agrococcus sp. GCM10030264]|uniref:hypothetical protein n=2 Tax=unclassified Agrococcus TaxID=2615065 RepID=UPI00360AF041
MRPRVLLRSAGIAASLASLALAGCGQPPVSQDFELAGPLTNEDMPLPDGASASLRYVTSTVCTSEVPCVEAWSSDVGLFLRFETVAHAESYAGEHSEVEWDRFVLVDFAGVDIALEERYEVAGIVFAQMPSGSA